MEQRITKAAEWAEAKKVADIMLQRDVETLRKQVEDTCPMERQKFSVSNDAWRVLGAEFMGKEERTENEEFCVAYCVRNGWM